MKSIVSANNDRPYHIAITAGLIAIIPLGLLWLVASMYIYFAAGGDLGGLGAGAKAGDASWQVPANIFISIIVMILDALIIIGIYKWSNRKLNSVSNKVVLPRKLIITAIILPALPFLALYINGYYIDNRSGVFNPYTQTCKDSGYRGARGDSCVE